MVGGSPPGRGRWFFTPGALAFAVAQGRGSAPLEQPAGPWLGIGLDADLDTNAGFTSFEYVPGDGSFGLRLRYEGHTRIDGPWRSPAVILAPGLAEAYGAIGAVTRARRGRAPSVAVATSRPAWWLEPMFCGWGAQVAAAAVEASPPGALARQDRYDPWLATLADAGIVPGTVVIDDKWQRTYGANEPDTAKWPDLRGWIDERHANGQRVLLWWKAWDHEGLPHEACVVNEAGIPVAADPTSPVYESVLRASSGRCWAMARLSSAADGLKIDFTAQTPSGASLKTAAERAGRTGPWGVALLHRLLAIVAGEARRVRPDALLITHTPDPLFHDVTSMLRLNDLLRLDDPEPLQPVVAQAHHRARLARAVTGDIPIDTDDWAMPSKAEWLAWQRAKVEVGVPALYHVDRVAGETIDRGGSRGGARGVVRLSATARPPGPVGHTRGALRGTVVMRPQDAARAAAERPSPTTTDARGPVHADVPTARRRRRGRRWSAWRSRATHPGARRGRHEARCGRRRPGRVGPRVPRRPGAS